jgi:hypothetical protein
MTCISLDWLIACAGGATVAGLLSKGRARRSPAFTAYLACIVVGSVLVLSWPRTFWTPWFWRVKAPAFVGLGAATVVEAARHGLRRAPGLEGAAVVLAAIGLVAFLWPVPNACPYSFYDRILQCLGFLVAWAGAALVILFAWCRSPASRLDWVVVVGLGFHLFVFGGLLWRLAPAWAASPTACRSSFLLVSTLWFAEAWRAEPRVGS